MLVFVLALPEPCLQAEDASASLWLRPAQKYSARIVTVSSPVVLNGLERFIHRVNPFGRFLQLLVAAGNNQSSPVKADSVRSGHIDLTGWSCKRRHQIIRIVHARNVSFIPCKIHAVSVVFAFGQVGIPILLECFDIDESILI